jgi:hypothetical protein
MKISHINTNKSFDFIAEVSRVKCRGHIEMVELETAIIVGDLGPYSQQFIFIVTYKCAKKARGFVPGKPLQHSVM